MFVGLHTSHWHTCTGVLAEKTWDRMHPFYLREKLNWQEKAFVGISQTRGLIV